MCDYASLFASVNRELVEDDLNKQRKNKTTNRYPITPLFRRATEIQEKITAILKEIKVVSLAQVVHKEGIDLPLDMQPYRTKDPSELLSIFGHFNDLDKLERNYKDVREYSSINSVKSEASNQENTN